MSPRSSPHSSGKQEHSASPRNLVCHTKHEQHGAVSGTFTMTTWVPSTPNILSYPHTHQKGHIPPQLHAWCQSYWSASTGGSLSGCCGCTSPVQPYTSFSLVWSTAWWLYYTEGDLPWQKQPRNTYSHLCQHFTWHWSPQPSCAGPLGLMHEPMRASHLGRGRANLLGKPQCSK